MMKLERKFDDGFTITWNITLSNEPEPDDKCPICYRGDCEWWFK